MKSIQDLKSLIPAFVLKAQKQYDDWIQDASGFDEEVGYGGICHLIADDIASVLSSNGFDATTLSLDSEVHVVAVAKTSDGVLIIDVPHYLYESGGGYNWKKKPNIHFDDSSIVISIVSSDPEFFNNYTD